MFDNELVFVDKLIGADLRNNSAWNQRYFVLNHMEFTPETIQYELTYVMNRIRLVKNNESTWNYLRGLLQHGTGKLDQYPEVSLFTATSVILAQPTIFDREHEVLLRCIHCHQI